MRVAVTASYFQPVLQTMSDVKGTGAGGHGRPVWMADCRDDLLYDSLFGFLSLPVSLPLSSPPSLSLADFSFPMFFSTCMPHYILKVNPINTEITLEDKLPGVFFSFPPDYHCMESLDSFSIDNFYWIFLKQLHTL